MKKEEEVLDLITEVWNNFLELDSQHPNEETEFCDAIHRCQYVIGLRFARESRPDLFPIKN